MQLTARVAASIKLMINQVDPGESPNVGGASYNAF